MTLIAPDSRGTGGGICKASLRIVENMQSVIDYACGFYVDRESHPGLIRDSELGFCRSVEDPNRLNEPVILNPPGDASFGTQTRYPGAISEQ